MSKIRVTVVFALPDAATEVTLYLPEGGTVADAIESAGIRTAAKGADASAAVGIFGQRVRRDRVLADGDRVELYRSLRTDPKQSRRRRTVDKKG